MGNSQKPQVKGSENKLTESVKINSLELENVKRVKAVKLEPAQSGLTIVGGRNGQGKTSVLDAISWALGGNRKKPSQPHREGSATDPYLHVELTNGLIVERKGKTSALKVIDPAGNKSGQNLLDQFIEALALDLPKFMESTSKEKAQTLLQIIGVGETIFELEAKEEKLFNQRTSIGQMERQKRGVAEEMQFYPGTPSEPVSAAELIQQQQEILARNGENQRKRERVTDIEAALASTEHDAQALADRISELGEQLSQKNADIEKLHEELATAKKSAAALQDESTSEIEASIAAIDETNAKVRTNAARAIAMKDADELKEQYEDLTREIESIRADKMKLLADAKLPLDGLTVEKGELIYNGNAWDCMSGSDQLRVATAIVRALKPECGFVLVDKLEQFDPQTLQEFGAWAESQDLQIIGTRVSTGDECSIVIEDGYSNAQVTPTSIPAPQLTTEQPNEEVNPWQMM